MVTIFDYKQKALFIKVTDCLVVIMGMAIPSLISKSLHLIRMAIKSLKAFGQEHILNIPTKLDWNW